MAAHAIDFNLLLHVADHALQFGTIALKLALAVRNAPRNRPCGYGSSARRPAS